MRNLLTNSDMSITVKKGHLLVIFILIFIIFYFGSSFLRPSPYVEKKIILQRNSDYIVWPKLQLSTDTRGWFKRYCLKSEETLSLENLMYIMQKWHSSTDIQCRNLYTVFTSIFTITEHPGKVVIPETFAVKVRKWLGGNENLFEAVKSQKILFIFNEYTREENVYNPLREKRPMSKPPRPERQYVEEISEKTAKTCDFCRYKKNTAEDVFGRVETEFAFTAANTFKLDTWHTLALIKDHHPLNWTHTQFNDLMTASQTWLKKAYNYKPERRHKYPMLIWDMLPHGGASQVHPHIHNFLDMNRYQGAIENWRMAANQYAQDFPGKNYFTDLIMVHMALGLAVKHGKAVALASLLPKKDNEVVIISENADSDFFDLMYFTYRAFIDDMQKLCYSSGIGLPSLDKNDNKGRIPAFARIITRGPVEDIRSDISSLELFTAQNANTDPYKVIAFIQKSIKKRGTFR